MKTKATYLLLIAMCTTLLSTSLSGSAAKQDQKQNAPYKIMCVGDSITQGGQKSREEYTYRLPLQKLLHEAKISFDFTGSRKAGLDSRAVWPDIAERFTCTGRCSYSSRYK
jgi:hypothetical protein